MHVRPQPGSFSIDQLILRRRMAGAPIAALLDGVPISEHPLLAGRLLVEDLFDLEDGVQVRDRRHGTAMASLIVHGDRNRVEPPLGRPVISVPVMTWDGHCETFPNDRLVVDMIHQAVIAMRAQPDPLGPDVLIVNLSLGNLRRPFHGQMSPWARLLDKLAWQHGILFVVSAGNAGERFAIGDCGTSGDISRSSSSRPPSEDIIAPSKRASIARPWIGDRPGRIAIASSLEGMGASGSVRIGLDTQSYTRSAVCTRAR